MRSGEGGDRVSRTVLCSPYALQVTTRDRGSSIETADRAPESDGSGTDVAHAISHRGSRRDEIK